MFLPHHARPEAQAAGMRGPWPHEQARVARERRELAAAPDAFGVGAMDRERLAALGLTREPRTT